MLAVIIFKHMDYFSAVGPNRVIYVDNMTAVANSIVEMALDKN